MRKDHPNSRGTLKRLVLDMTDLSAVAAAADRVRASEARLHLLFNNASAQMSVHPQPVPPTAVTTSTNLTAAFTTDRSAQGHELHLAVNCLAHFVLTQRLTPLLAAAANSSPKHSVRVLWAAGAAMWPGDTYPGALRGGIPLDNLDYHLDRNPMYKSAFSKAGCYLLAVEYGRRHAQDGIVSVVSTPTHPLSISLSLVMP